MTLDFLHSSMKICNPSKPLLPAFGAGRALPRAFITLKAKFVRNTYKQLQFWTISYISTPGGFSHFLFLLPFNVGFSGGGTSTRKTPILNATFFYSSMPIKGISSFHASFDIYVRIVTRNITKKSMEKYDESLVINYFKM